MINHNLINKDVPVHIIPSGYIKQTTYSEFENNVPQTILYIDSERYYIPVFQLNIDGQKIYIGKNKIDSINKQRQFNPSFEEIQGEEIIGTNMSKSNILKQSYVQKENMYEYFIVINNNDSIPGKFFAFSNEKISINTVNKIDENDQKFFIEWFYSDY